MTPSRLAALTVLVVACFTLLSKTATAQDPPLPTNKADSEAIRTFMEGRGIAAAELPEARKQFKLYAQYNAEIIAASARLQVRPDPSTKDPKGGRINRSKA